MKSFCEYLDENISPRFIIIIIHDQQHGCHAVEVIIEVIDKNVDTVSISSNLHARSAAAEAATRGPSHHAVHFSSSSSKPRAERVPRASQWPIIIRYTDFN